MKRSTERILTTHTGSLQKPADLRALLSRRQAEELSAGDRETLQRRTRAAVAETVRRQLEVGLDIIDDGEVSKTSFFDYIGARLGGLARRPGALKLHHLPPWNVEAGLVRPREARTTYLESAEAPGHYRSDVAEFHEFARTQQGGNLGGVATYCVGPLTLEDPSAVRTDVDTLTAALAGQRPVEVFMPAVSPGMVARTVRNVFYPNDETFLQAIADVMRDEYEAIVGAGFVLQLDCPDLASGANTDYADLSISEFRKLVELHVEVLNYAVRDLPAEQIRIHVCWGNYEGPHHLDIDASKIADVVLKAKPATILFEAANPRHEHEWAAWREADIPADKILAPGVIDSTCNYIEHPGLVAQRLERYAEIVGADRVMAGTDCGFGTWSGFGSVDPDICWAKLAALSDGARRASGRP